MGIFKRNQSTPVTMLPPPRPVYDVSKQAVQISAVYRSVSILATSVSQMSGQVLRGTKTVTKPAWLSQPDPTMSVEAFNELTVTSLAMNGNAFWRIYRNERGDVLMAKVLDPNTVEVALRDGVRVYRHNQVELNANEIKHLELLRLPGQLRGVGPIQASRYSLEGMLALQGYQNEWFQGKGIPQGILKTEQPLNGSMADEYENRWNEKLANAAQAGTTPIVVLGNGVDYKPIMINPKDAMYLDIAQFSVSEVGRLFGIPPHYLGSGIDGSSLTYSTAVDLDIAYLRYGLSQYLVEIESAISALLPRGTSYKFDTRSLLRTNDKLRFESYNLALTGGWLTIDEVRELEGLEPLPEPEPKPVPEVPAIEPTPEVPNEGN
jgi:HK97 family phage portal protein